MSQLPTQPQLTIYRCYNEFLVDPALLQSFPEDEWMSIHGLTYLGTLHFCVVLEELFTQLISPDLWGQVRADFINNFSRKAMSEEVVPMAILVTDGVDEGSLEMVTIFCHSDQAKPTIFYFPSCAYAGYCCTPLLRSPCLARKREIG